MLLTQRCQQTGPIPQLLVAVDLAGNKTNLAPVDILVDQSMPAAPTDIAVENQVIFNDVSYLGSQTFTVTGKGQAGTTGYTAFLNIDGTQTPEVPVAEDGSWSVTYTTASTKQVSFTAQIANSAKTQSGESASLDFKLDLDRPSIQSFVDPDQTQSIKVFHPVNVTLKLSEPVQVAGVPKCKLLAGGKTL